MIRSFLLAFCHFFWLINPLSADNTEATRQQLKSFQQAYAKLATHCADVAATNSALKKQLQERKAAHANRYDRIHQMDQQHADLEERLHNAQKRHTRHTKALHTKSQWALGRYLHNQKRKANAPL